MNIIRCKLSDYPANCPDWCKHIQVSDVWGSITWSSAMVPWHLTQLTAIPPCWRNWNKYGRETLLGWSHDESRDVETHWHDATSKISEVLWEWASFSKWPAGMIDVANRFGGHDGIIREGWFLRHVVVHCVKEFEVVSWWRHHISI